MPNEARQSQCTHVRLNEGCREHLNSAMCTYYAFLQVVSQFIIFLDKKHLHTCVQIFKKYWSEQTDNIKLIFFLGKKEKQLHEKGKFHLA